MKIQNKSFLKNYLQTYFWNGVAIILNIASMFIVIPMISNNQVIFGIYSICISTAIFLQYADIGFVGAGIKFAGESYAKGEYETEIKYYGFFSFILLIFIFFISSFYLLFSYNPSLLINGIESNKHIATASKLLFIQAIFSFNTIFKRFLSGAFQVRIEGYIYQRILIFSSILKLVSIFYFFNSGHYNIVGYYLFIKTIELVVSIIGIRILKYKYHISFLQFVKSIKFDRNIFNKTKALAFNSIFLTIIWILYYEIDLIVIGRIYGAIDVAIYALAFTFIKFLRSLSAIIFNPFQNRFNHLVGLNKIDDLKSILPKIIRFSMPLFLFTVVSIMVLHNHIVLAWAGADFSESGLILIFLSSSFMLLFVITPCANVFTALERIKELYLISILMIAFYWGGIFITQGFWGVNSFAIFKLVARIVGAIFYIKFLLVFLNQNQIELFKHTILKMFLPIVSQVLFLFMIMQYLPVIKGKINLILVIGTGGISVVLGFVVLYLTSIHYKTEFVHYFRKALTS